MRLWCEQSGASGIAMHPTSHLENAEHLGYQLLHQLHRVQFGAPEMVSDRLFRLADLQALPERPGAVLLEIPCRPLGGELPEWGQLEDICGWAREMSIPIHLDGARIWQCRAPYVAAAKQGLASCLVQIPAWNQRAKQVAAVINAVPGLKTRPVIPDVNFFQLFFDAEVEALDTVNRQLAEETGTFVFRGFALPPSLEFR